MDMTESAPGVSKTDLHCPRRSIYFCTRITQKFTASKEVDFTGLRLLKIERDFRIPVLAVPRQPPAARLSIREEGAAMIDREFGRQTKLIVTEPVG
jgi:hypothetical protein